MVKRAMKTGAGFSVERLRCVSHDEIMKMGVGFRVEGLIKLCIS
jgi:hypothetical protein